MVLAGAQQYVQAVCDLAVGGAGLVLVDERGSLIVVAHASHQVAQADSYVGDERVASAYDMKGCAKVVLSGSSAVGGWRN